MLRMIVAAYSKLRLHVDRVAALEPLALGFPTRDLVDAAARVLVERDVEPLDQIGPVALDEPRHVLGEVLARLGDEVAEVLAAPRSARGSSSGTAPDSRQRAQPRVEVFAVALEAEVERHVVDAGGEVVDLPVRDAEIAATARTRCPARCGTGRRSGSLLARVIARQLIAIGFV